MTIFQLGNTVKLQCIFEKDINGIPTPFNPDYVNIVITNHLHEELKTVALNPATHTKEIGKWFYYYTLPLEEGRFYYEFNALVGKEVIVQRKAIQTTFV